MRRSHCELVHPSILSARTCWRKTNKQGQINNKYGSGGWSGELNINENNTKLAKGIIYGAVFVAEAIIIFYGTAVSTVSMYRVSMDKSLKQLCSLIITFCTETVHKFILLMLICPINSGIYLNVDTLNFWLFKVTSVLLNKSIRKMTYFKIFPFFPNNVTFTVHLVVKKGN